MKDNLTHRYQSAAESHMYHVELKNISTLYISIQDAMLKNYYWVCQTINFVSNK